GCGTSHPPGAFRLCFCWVSCFQAASHTRFPGRAWCSPDHPGEGPNRERVGLAAVRKRILGGIGVVSGCLLSVRVCWLNMSVAVKTLNMPDAVWELLDTAALTETRSRSNMAAVLIQEALWARQNRSFDGTRLL